MPSEVRSQVVIIGGGPAGLTAALELCENGGKCLVFEKDRKYLGGLSRTVEHKGNRFDIGGHRFFSKSKEVEDWWSHILSPSEFVEVKRKSRIYYRGRFYDYPLNPTQVFKNLGIFESFCCLLS